MHSGAGPTVQTFQLPGIFVRIDNRYALMDVYNNETVSLWVRFMTKNFVLPLNWQRVWQFSDYRFAAKIRSWMVTRSFNRLICYEERSYSHTTLPPTGTRQSKSSQARFSMPCPPHVARGVALGYYIQVRGSRFAVRRTTVLMDIIFWADMAECRLGCCPT